MIKQLSSRWLCVGILQKTFEENTEQHVIYTSLLPLHVCRHAVLPVLVECFHHLRWISGFRQQHHTISPSCYVVVEEHERARVVVLCCGRDGCVYMSQQRKKQSVTPLLLSGNNAQQLSKCGWLFLDNACTGKKTKADDVILTQNLFEVLKKTIYVKLSIKIKFLLHHCISDN